jgi:hypothetical protein
VSKEQPLRSSAITVTRHLAAHLLDVYDKPEMARPWNSHGTRMEQPSNMDEQLVRRGRTTRSVAASPQSAGRHRSDVVRKISPGSCSPVRGTLKERVRLVLEGQA